ncbi:MAG: hypothetical protein ABI923_05195 [bacterium]
MKRFVIAVALAFVVSATALAGEIPSTGAQASPPPEASSPVLTVLLIIINAVAG